MKEAAMAAMVAEATKRWSRIDVLHYNVGVSLGGGDAPLAEITEEAFDRVMAINLRGAVMAAKHALPVMRAQKSGVILMISRSRRSRTTRTSPTRRARRRWWPSSSSSQSATPTRACAPTRSCPA